MMGRGCILCGRVRPNERFGGRGLRARICDLCRQMPKLEQKKALRLRELQGFLEQSNISKKNIKRLSVLEADPIPEVAEFASFVRQIAVAYPRRRGRWKWLRQNRRELLKRGGVKANVFDAIVPDQEYEDELEWSQENGFLDDSRELADFNDIWIEARLYECEPTSAEIRVAFGNGQ